MKRVVQILWLIPLLYLAGLAAVFMLQRQFMYIPPAGPVETVLPPEGASNVELVIAGGDETFAWWYPPRDDAPVIIFFHGNGSAVYQAGFLYEQFSGAGFGYLIPEYPGYFGTAGNSTEETIISAAEESYDFLIENGVEPENIYLYGTSLGAGVALQLAARRPVGKIALEAPFYSMTAMTKLTMPIFALEPLVKDKWESYRALDELDVPILWLHGTRDRIIPMSEGQRLYDLYDGPKDKFVIDGASHVNVWAAGGGNRIIEFFNAPDDRP